MMFKVEAKGLIAKTMLICHPIRKREILYRIYVALATGNINSRSTRPTAVMRAGLVINGLAVDMKLYFKTTSLNKTSM